MTRRFISAAWWLGIAMALAAATLLLFAEVTQPDCEGALLVIANTGESAIARDMADRAPSLAACKESRNTLGTLAAVAIALFATAFLILGASLALRVRLQRQFPARYVVRDDLGPRV